MTTRIAMRPTKVFIERQIKTTKQFEKLVFDITEMIDTNRTKNGKIKVYVSVTPNEREMSV